MSLLWIVEDFKEDFNQCVEVKFTFERISTLTVFAIQFCY